MVHGVASGAVDDWVIRVELAVVDQNGPDLDEGEEGDVCELLEGKEEGEDVVWHALRPAVKWVEGVAGEGRGQNPLVVRLVETLVDGRNVETAVNPVDAKVGEHEEERELQIGVPSAEVPGR